MEARQTPGLIQRMAKRSGSISARSDKAVEWQPGMAAVMTASTQSADKQKLGKTSKMGQRDIRRLLVIGATAVIRWASRRGAPKGSWLARMLERKPVPVDAADDVIEASGGFAGKIVVDITNPMTADFSGLSIGHSTSAAEEIQKRAPQAKVVKAFNTIFAQVLQNGGQASGQAATVLVASDDESARNAVVELARSAGFDTLETGGLATARYLEPVAALNITLGYGLGHGTDIAPTWQRAA